MVESYGARLAPVRRAYVLFAVALVAALILSQWPHLVPWAASRALADLSITAVAGGAAALALVRAAKLPSQRRLAWGLLGLGCLSWALGNVAWTVDEVVKGIAVPIPSLADLGYLLLVPLAAAGLLVMVVGSTTVVSRTRHMLDALMVGTAALFITYAIGLKPFIEEIGRQPSWVARAVPLAYMVGDMFLLSLLVLVMSRVGLAARRALMWMGLALVAVMFSNWGLWLDSGPRGNVWTDVGRAIGFLLVGYAAIRPVPEYDVPAAPKPGPVAAALPLIPFVLCIMVTVQLEARYGGLDPFIFWSAVILIVLLAARQFFHVHENLLLRRQADVALESVRLHEQLRTQMLNNITHDMRHNLSPAVMHLGMLEAWGDPLTERQHRSLGIIKRSTDQVTRLAADLGDTVSLQAGRFSLQSGPVDLAEVARGTAESLRQAAEDRGVMLEASAADAVTITGDRDRLGQVIFNLVSNAIRFTPRGGHVHVTVAASKEGARVSVTDEGRGLAADEIARLFQPFSQVHSRSDAKGGMGLGLFITRGIVEGHGGSVTAQSAGLGRGSTFLVLLPTAATPLVAQAPRLQGPADAPPTTVAGIAPRLSQND